MAGQLNEESRNAKGKDLNEKRYFQEKTLGSSLFFLKRKKKKSKI